MSANLFGLPQNCKLLNLCGKYGFPDRCNTCGHDASKQNPPEDFMEEHKRRMEELFQRQNDIIFGTGKKES